jgi:hypothetical protein
MNKHFLKNSVKRWLQLTLVLFVIAGWFIIKHQLTPPQKPTAPMRLVPILPPLIYKDQGEVIPWRADFFSIANLNRLDSTALLIFIAQNACQIADTIHLEQYGPYRMEFYEHGQYLNDSTYHSRDRPLFHTADELDAFVSWVIYQRGELTEIQWYNTGEEDSSRIIPITKEVKQLFEQCRKK